jgi:hypothetical protein
VELDSRTKGAIVDENYQTNIEGIFAAGNALHVHDLVDFVSIEAENLAESVVDYLNNGKLPDCPLQIEPDQLVGYTVPQRISGKKDLVLSLRVRSPLKNCSLQVIQDDKVLKTKKMRKAIPAEMIRIKIKKEDLLSIESKSIDRKSSANRALDSRSSDNRSSENIKVVVNDE